MCLKVGQDGIQEHRVPDAHAAAGFGIGPFTPDAVSDTMYRGALGLVLRLGQFADALAYGGIKIGRCTGNEALHPAGMCHTKDFSGVSLAGFDALVV